MKLKHLKEVHKADWPLKQPKELARLYRSRDFLVQEYHEGDVIRLTICRTQIKGKRWVDGISWDELQAIKALVGYGNYCALEVYPEDVNVVNVANMRHLFITNERPEFAWRKGR